MAGHVQVGHLPQKAVTIASACRRLCLPAAAFVCLLSSCYFALVIAPAGLGVSAPTVQQGLLPGWLGCREILHARNPYRPEITHQAERSVYGTMGSSGDSRNQHRFAYPVFFVFLFFAVALLPFEAAQLGMLAACTLLSLISVRLWAHGTELRGPSLFTGTLLTLASYPVVLALQLRQPTLVIAALLALSTFYLRSGKLVWAGILGGLCASKPHLAIAVLLPLSIWSISHWSSRKRFVLSLGATLLGLFIASQVLVPGWIPDWLATLRAYTHYAGARPLLAEMLRGHFIMGASVLLLAAVVWVTFEFGDSDLLFTISFSVAAFQLLFPFQIYNEVLLLPAALWSAANAAKIRACGQSHVLLFGCAWTALGSGWAAAVALAVGNLLMPGTGVKLWQLPLAAAWLYPMLLFVALAMFAASSLMAQRRTAMLREAAA